MGAILARMGSALAQTVSALAQNLLLFLGIVVIVGNKVNHRPANFKGHFDDFYADINDSADDGANAARE